MRTGLILTLATVASVALGACSGSERTHSPHSRPRAGEDAAAVDGSSPDEVAADAATWAPATRPDAAGDAAAPQPRDSGTGAAPPSTPSAPVTEDAGEVDAPPHDHGEDAGQAPTDAAIGGVLCASCGGCEEVFPVTSRLHTPDPIQYPNPPPTNGPHNPCWARWGVHATEVLDDRWVHNLEHGGVLFLYNCPEGCAADVAALERLATSRRRTLLAPYAALPTRFAVVAWSHRLLTDCVDEVAFAKFYDANFDHGVESLDDQPDAACPP